MTWSFNVMANLMANPFACMKSTFDVINVALLSTEPDAKVDILSLEKLIVVLRRYWQGMYRTAPSGHIGNCYHDLHEQ
jgi:hypothetical protein